MVAGYGEIVGKDCACPGIAGVRPLAAGDLVDAPPEYAKRQVVLILAGSLAGFTPGTRTCIKGEGVGYDDLRRRFILEVCAFND
jgi:hypothetical protein